MASLIVWIWINRKEWKGLWNVTRRVKEIFNAIHLERVNVLDRCDGNFHLNNNGQTVLPNKNIQKDYAISFTRMIATVFIVVCHILQFYGNSLCFWFNVGVQMFLFISGFLYSKKINNTLAWLNKNFLKILIPYYTVSLVYLIFYFCFVSKLNIKMMINVLVLYCNGETVDGLRHLWFISYILLAYLMTPLFLKLFEIFEKNDKTMIIGSLFIVFAVYIFFTLYADYYTAAWMVCYFLGVLYGRCIHGAFQTLVEIIRIFVLSGTIILNVIRLLISHFKMIYVSAEIYSYIENYGHVFLGISFVWFFCFIYNRLLINKKVINRLCDFFDNLSYNIYLVHQCFILGSFSVLNLFDNKIFSIIFLVVIIVFVAILCHWINKKSFDFLEYIRKRRCV